ncbi:MAG: extracellular solute-binding protein [Thermomicrobiales bacterium]
MSVIDLQELVQAWQEGKLSRRAFMTRAMALGLTAGAASAVLAGRRSAAAQEEAPTPTPIVETHGAEEAGVKIRYWTILSGPDGDEMNELVRAFAEENPDIAVESLQGLTDFEPKIQAAAISGTAPDVALIRHHYIGPFASRNILSPIDPSELEQAGIKGEDYDPTVWQFTGYQDQQYTIPLDIHCFAMMHNKTRLTDAGLAVPTTLDELMAVAQATTTDDVVGYMNWILNNANSALGFTWLWFTFQRQFGGQFLSEDGTQSAFNTPEGIEALTWMKQLEEAGNPQHLPYFDLNRNGQVVTWPDGPWIITAMFNPEQAPAAADLEAAPLPQRDPNAPAVWAQSHQFSFPRQGDEDEARRAASLKFVNWLTEHSVDWASAGQVPARNSAREQALASEDLYLQKLQAWASQLSFANYMPTNVPNMLELLPRLGSHVQEAILGQKSVEDALTDAESEVNDILAS